MNGGAGSLATRPGPARRLQAPDPLAARLAAGEPAQLGTHIGTGTALPTVSFDGGIELGEDGEEGAPIRVSAEVPALGHPLGRSAVAAPDVAAFTGRDLVLDPTGTALEPGHDMLGGGRHEAVIEWAAAPHAGRAIARKDHLHALSAVQHACHMDMLT
jgi:hypothetical protein